MILAVMGVCATGDSWSMQDESKSNKSDILSSDAKPVRPGVQKLKTQKKAQEITMLLTRNRLEQPRYEFKPAG